MRININRLRDHGFNVEVSEDEVVITAIQTDSSLSNMMSKSLRNMYGFTDIELDQAIYPAMSKIEQILILRAIGEG